MTKEFTDFYESASAYCDFIESNSSKSKIDFLQTVRQRLLVLYDSALKLQWVDLQSNIEYEVVLDDIYADLPDLQSHWSEDTLIGIAAVLPSQEVGLETLEYLEKLQITKIATVREIMTLIEKHDLHDSGCGAIDMSLLASTLITDNAKIWTQDKKLETLSKKLGISFTPELH